MSFCIGLEEMELDRIYQLWNQVKEVVKADMEELVKTEPLHRTG